MKTRIFSRVIQLLFFLPLLAYSQNQLSGTVKGIDGAPLKGVQVEIQETFFKTYSDKNGVFVFGNLPAAEYQIDFSADGFDPLTKTLVLQKQNQELEVTLNRQSLLLDEVTLSAIRANEKTPTTYSEIGLEEVERRNFGQDMTYLLNSTPSTVATSDAGAGVGYTGIRIRGVDPT